VLRDAVDDLASALIGAAGSPRERYVFVRIAAAVAAQAQLAVRRGVANESDIDTALKLAASYPHGPFEWIRRAGTARFDALRAALDEHVEPRRFVLR